MGEWQPIETWPKTDGERALVWDGDIELAMYDAEADAWWVLVEYTVNPTHWQPLPPPPTSIKSERE
jgi:hypothetical protein